MSKYHLTFIYILIIILFSWMAFPSFKSKQPDVFSADDSKEATFLNPAEGGQPLIKMFELPENPNFAGEPVPLKNPDILERFEREIYVNAYWHSNTIMLMKRAGKFLPIIEPILAKNGIPDDFKYLAMIESGLMNVVSPAGARGFWQFMESTGKEYKLEINREVDERYHLEKSTQAACDYLKTAYARFGNWTNVAASYNMGIAGLTRRINNQQMPNYYDLYLNEETSRYLFRILAIKEIFENPKKHGFAFQNDDLYRMPTFRELMVAERIDDLASWAIKHNSNYKELKIYNPWLRSDKLTLASKGRSYKILLP